jgi:hypothetical protein
MMLFGIFSLQKTSSIFVQVYCKFLFSKEFDKVKELGEEFLELWCMKHRNERLSLKMENLLSDEQPKDGVPEDVADAEVVTVDDTTTPF